MENGKRRVKINKHITKHTTMIITCTQAATTTTKKLSINFMVLPKY